MRTPLLTYGPAVDTPDGRSAVDLLERVLAWRWSLSPERARQLTASEASEWAVGLAPLSQDEGLVFSAGARLERVLDDARLWRAQPPLDAGQLEELVTHPDPRISECLLRLTTPGDTTQLAGLTPPGVWAASSAEAFAVFQRLSDDEQRGRLLPLYEALALGWQRIARDVERELHQGAVGTPLQHALVEHWLVWDAVLRFECVEREQRMRAAVVSPGEPPSGGGVPVVVPMPVLVRRVVVAIGGLLVEPPAVSQPTPGEGPVRSRAATEAWRWLADLVLHGSSRVRAATGSRPSSSSLALDRLAEVLLAVEDHEGQPADARIRQVALDAGVRWLMGFSLSEPDGRRLRDVLLAPLEQLEPAARATWVTAGRDVARVCLAAHGHWGLHLGAVWEQPLTPDGTYTAAFLDAWESVSSSPMLWRVAAALAGLDPATRALPSALDTGTWAWCVWGEPAEVAVQLRALGEELLAGALDADNDAVVLQHVRQLSATQLAACSAATWRPWLLQPHRELRAWALGALGQSADPVVRAVAGPTERASSRRRGSCG